MYLHLTNNIWGGEARKKQITNITSTPAICKNFSFYAKIIIKSIITLPVIN
jgi:hypothetical protein